MEALLAALEASPLATATRFDRWVYAAVNGAHILGVALLVGAVVPLDLRHLGLWPGVDRKALARVLAPTAAAGLALAVVTGALLFASRASEYADLRVFQAKLALVLTGAIAALAARRRYGPALEAASPGRRAQIACLSLGCWIGALGLGRLIAFVGG
ncbi:MAG: hypothetical protein RIM80_01990 [Alphaproteobacteria bacterium]